MKRALGSAAALLFGMFLLLLGNGLKTSLLGVRATLEHFDSVAVGVIMSAFYVGFLAGAVYTPGVVQKVGHIRVFTAWASIASAAVLLHAAFVNPATWVAMRFFTGFAYAGMYVVAESWLNDSVSNEHRGTLLSIYMVIQYVGMAAGQFLLNVASPLGYDLFILVSVLVSMSLVPIALSTSPVPGYQAQSRLSLRQLFKLTPLGVVAALCTGATTGAFLAMGPVYAQRIGLSIRDTSLFMALAIIGCVLLQVPLGRTSDRMGRRAVISLTALASAALCIAGTFYANGALAYVIVFLVGATTLPLYALSLAWANDELAANQRLAASSGLVFAFGLGAATGPLTVSVAFNLLGNSGFYGALAALHGFFFLYVLYRTTRRDALPPEARTRFRAVPLSVINIPWLRRRKR